MLYKFAIYIFFLRIFQITSEKKLKKKSGEIFQIISEKNLKKNLGRYTDASEKCCIVNSP